MSELAIAIIENLFGEITPDSEDLVKNIDEKKLKYAFAASMWHVELTADIVNDICEILRKHGQEPIYLVSETKYANLPYE